MADVVKEIEITAALSADYQSTFKAASSIAASSARELSQLTKREADLQKLLELSSKGAEAAAAGNSKQAEKLASDYEKLAEKLGLVDKSAQGVEKELAAVGARKKDVEELNASATKSASFGRLARDIDLYTKASKKTKDPALLKQLDAMKAKFKAMGGTIPDEKKLGFFKSLKDSFVNLPGPIGGVARDLKGLGDAFSSPAGKATLVVGGFAAVGAAAVSAAKKVWELGKSTIETADAISKTAKQVGIDAEAYQEFAWAVGLGNVSEQELASGLQQLNKQMEAATNGNSKAQKAFKSLGISMDEVKSMNTEEMFVRLSDALSQVDDTAAKTQTTMALFGGSGTKIAEAIKDGSGALEEMRKEARDSGYVLAREDLERAEIAADNFSRAQMQVKGALNQIGVDVMPTINGMLTDFIDFMRDNRQTIREFAGLVAKGFRLVGIAIGGVMKAVNVGAKVIGFAYDYWVDKFSGLFHWFDDTGTAISAWCSDFKRDVIDVYDSIAGGVSSAIAFVVDKFDLLTEWGSGAVDSIVEWFKSIPAAVSDVFSEAWEGIKTWWSDLETSVGTWIRGIIDDLTNAVMSKLSWLSDALSQIPIIGDLFGDSDKAVAAGGGNITIQVQNSIDARGAQPGAGAEIGRAVRASGGQTGESVANALAGYQELSYSGGAR